MEVLDFRAREWQDEEQGRKGNEMSQKIAEAGLKSGLQDAL